MDETPYIIEIDAAERGGSPFGDLEDDSIHATGDEEELADSPITLDLTADNWADVDDELNDFLNETDTDANSESDSDSVRSENSTTSEAKQVKTHKRKRTKSTDVSEAEESDNSATSSSRLQRRKRRTLERVTSLTNVVTAEKPSSGLPSPEATGPEEGHVEEKANAPTANGVLPDAQDDYDDPLEAELLAGLEDSDRE